MSAKGQDLQLIGLYLEQEKYKLLHSGDYEPLKGA
jgi:hypothetical protein